MHRLIMDTRFERSLDAWVNLFRTIGGYGEDPETSWNS
jgi:hypothetical protein